MVKSSIPARAKADLNAADEYATSTLRSSAPNRASVGVRTLDSVSAGSKRIKRRRSFAVAGAGGIGDFGGIKKGRYEAVNQGFVLAAAYSSRAVSQGSVPKRAPVKARQVFVAEVIASAS